MPINKTELCDYRSITELDRLGIEAVNRCEIALSNRVPLIALDLESLETASASYEFNTGLYELAKIGHGVALRKNDKLPETLEQAELLWVPTAIKYALCSGELLKTHPVISPKPQDLEFITAERRRIFRDMLCRVDNQSADPLSRSWTELLLLGRLGLKEAEGLIEV